MFLRHRVLKSSHCLRNGDITAAHATELEPVAATAMSLIFGRTIKTEFIVVFYDSIVRYDICVLCKMLLTEEHAAIL